MRISSRIEPFVITENSQLIDCLRQIDANKLGCVFIVDENGVLTGVLTDGDFRRWLTNQSHPDLSQPVSLAMNKKYEHGKFGQRARELSLHFSPKFKLLPLVDNDNRLRAIAFRDLDGIEIGSRTISSQTPTFIVAEIGNNHNGDYERAKALVDAAIEAGADCVKFQMRNMAAVYKNKGSTKDDSADLGTQYVLSLLEKFQLDDDQLLQLFDYCASREVLPMCTPWDSESLKVLEVYGMQAYKVASADFTNLPFLEELARTGKPLFCSTGMSEEREIIRSATYLQNNAESFVLLHCNSTYPAPYKDINLNYIKRLRKLTDSVVGYSGHELGHDVAVAAVVLGARVIEKHFTLDRNLEGNDHKVSLLPDEFAQMVTAIRQVETALGSDSPRQISQGEMMNRESLSKSLVASRAINKSERISRDMIEVKSPGQGLPPYHIDDLVGRTAVRNFKEGDFFFQTDIDGTEVQADSYEFSQAFGIPVRFHDYHALVASSNLDFVEFHLSVQDLEVELDDVFTEKQKIGFAVHAPELFANDHILDLASEDEEYRQQSIAHLKSVIDITKRLKSFFPVTSRPLIVINAGGASDREFLPKEQIQAHYDRVAEALKACEDEEVELIIQSMPPFPWHFGGQRYHNLFIAPEEIAEFCRANETRICLDISHAMMACNYHGWSLADYVRLTGAFAAHLHIADASGDSGEGVQIGKGDVDFAELAVHIKNNAPDASFIPEIWQGHKNGGEGFWQALAFLQVNFKS